ncbi:MAG: hypothetical protein H8E37_05340 [Planctomycetes bacterium]|nr:hypothetical protein [Planctomycetota bacterium]
MSKQTIILVGAVLLLSIFSMSRSQAVDNGWRDLPPLPVMPVNGRGELRRFEHIGVYKDGSDHAFGGVTIFVLDHDTGDVIKHSFGEGTQPPQVVQSTASDDKR